MVIIYGLFPQPASLVICNFSPKKLSFFLNTDGKESYTLNTAVIGK
jgi:hypothetical protein